MLWTRSAQFLPYPFELEKDLESAIEEVKAELFGQKRLYLEVKRLIGAKGGQQNIPDGYVLDLSSVKSPKLFVVEVDLNRHHPLKHIAVQLLEFSFAFETNPRLVKQVIRDAIKKEPATEAEVTRFAKTNGFDNIDYLLDHIVHRKEAFNALLIIDEISDQLENVLRTKFQFPVEILTLECFRSAAGEVIYSFDPLLGDVDASDTGSELPAIDPAELDTIVVPAQEDGFQETALGENRWHAIRLSAAMIPQIKYLAVYRVAPSSSITHWAEVLKIQPWNDTGKYELVFKSGMEEFVKPIRLVPGGEVKAPQGPRYASMTRLRAADSLETAF